MPEPTKTHAVIPGWTNRISELPLERLSRQVPASSPREPLYVQAPFNNTSIGSVPACREEDVRESVRRAREAQEQWKRTSFSQRKKIILAFHDLLLQRRDTALDLMQIEGGKARRHAFEEIIDVAINSRYYAYHAPRHLRTRRRRGALPLLTRTSEYRHPVGVVGLIIPWNYPLTLAISDAIPALLAGNAVVLKPDVQTSFTALWAVQLLREAGLPENLFQVLTGHGPDIGPPLIENADFIGFTGSTATGRIIARQAGENLIKCSLELGGKNAMLILDDADLDRAVEGAIVGCFTNAGQLCISFEHIYVHDSLYGKFIEAFTNRIERMQLGAGNDLDTEMGSIISDKQLQNIEAHVEQARQLGATVVTGGKRRPDLGPLFYEPTVLTGTDERMDLCCEETFGPVVSVHRFTKLEEAIQAVNDSPYGLNASVWTSNTSLGRLLARRIKCGTVNINDAYAASWASVDAPMGGMKASGLGRRHGAEGILKYTEVQTVATQRGISIAPNRWLPAHRFYPLMVRAMNILKHIPGLR